MVRVLFVCLGNICRSPMDEAVFLHQVAAAGLQERITARSAGTGNWHIGEAPHHGTQHILAANGIAYRHCARQITPQDLEISDYVLTMDDANFRAVRAMAPGKARVIPFLDFAPTCGIREVPDPYYTGDFGEVYALIEQASAGLLTAIREEYAL